MLKNAIKRTKFSNAEYRKMAEASKIWGLLRYVGDCGSDENKVLRYLAWEVKYTKNLRQVKKLHRLYDTLRVRRELSELLALYLITKKEAKQEAAVKTVLDKVEINNTDTIWLGEVLRAWRPFTQWLKETDSEKKVLKCIVYEMQNECRPAFLDRLRTRFNSIRVKRELAELEEMTNKVISLIYRK